MEVICNENVALFQGIGCCVAVIYHNDELSWLFTDRFSATRNMKVKRMGIIEILRRSWLFSTNKI